MLARLYRNKQFRTFYLADLDAIMQTGNNQEIILRILETYPDITCWVDIGIRHQEDYLKLKQLHHNIVPIIPTETLLDSKLLRTIVGDNYILSLDFKAQQLLGVEEILKQSYYWPNTIIVLSLDAVGGNTPDLVSLQKVIRYQEQNHHPLRRIIVGGGVRNAQDLQSLDKVADGVLVATALYNGALP